MAQATTTRHPFPESFAARSKQLANSGPPWQQQQRRDAAARFEQLGFPTTKLEAWKTTNVSPIVKSTFAPATRDAAKVSAAELPGPARLDLGGPRLFFLDGHFLAGMSSVRELPEGVEVRSLAAALEYFPERLQDHLAGRQHGESSAFLALNDALYEDGAVVLVPEGVKVDRPIQLLFCSSGGEEALASHPRSLIVVGRGGDARVVESYVGLGGGTYFTNAATETFVGDNARLEHYRIQLEGPSAYHISNNNSRQGRDSHYVHHNFNLGGKLVRHDVAAVLDGEGAWCHLNGLYLTRDQQHVDNHTFLDHAQPHCESREVYKGLLDGRSRAVFNGRIIVRPGAQKTDAKQSNPNILLSPGALANTRPQLEIYADDVKCTHGATIGCIDENAVFYLRSRGLSDADARHLLTTAFAGEVLEQVEIASLREMLEHLVAERLSDGGSTR